MAARRFKDDSLRREGWDYSNPGWYFLTMACKDRQPLFGSIEEGKMFLNNYGRIVDSEWIQSAIIRPSIRLGEHVVMPDHFHALVQILPCGDRQLSVPTELSVPTRPPRSISSLVAGFKATSTRKINEIRGFSGEKVWQSDYHDRIVRDEGELNRIAKYIAENPMRWRSE